MQKRETVGKVSTDLLRKADIADHSAQEQMQEMLSSFEENMFIAIDRGRAKWNGDFYIEVQTKKEPKMQNVLRNYYIDKMCCPTPTYDQAVYKYYRSSDDLEFLWNLPDKKTYYMIKDRFLEMPADQKQLVQFVFDDLDGTLLKKCKQLNGEL